MFEILDVNFLRYVEVAILITTVAIHYFYILVLTVHRPLRIAGNLTAKLLHFNDIFVCKDSFTIFLTSENHVDLIFITRHYFWPFNLVKRNV